MEEFGLLSVKEAVLSNNAIRVEKLIARKVAKDPEIDLDAEDEDGETLLHIAARAGYDDVVSVLVDAGCDPCVYNDLGLGALHVAVKAGHVPCVELMTDAMADVNARVSEGVVYAGYSALHMAVHAKQGKVLRFLLNRCEGIDLGALTENGQTVLHLAAANNFVDAIVLLLQKGSPDPNAASGKDGSTALMIAAGRNNLDATRALLLGGVALNTADNSGDTALHHAVKVQIQRLFSFRFDLDDTALEITYQLIRAGADITRTNMDDEVPLDNLSPDGAALFETVAEHRGAFTSSFPTFSDFLACDGAADLQAAGLPPDLCALLTPRLTAYHVELREVEEEEAQRGSCPFVDKKGKLRRRKQPLAKYVTEDVPPTTTTSTTTTTTTKGSGATEGKCPLGFTGPKPAWLGGSGDDTSSSESGGKCPLGFGATEDAAGDPVQKPSNCPYHRAIAAMSSPIFYVPATALSVAVAVAIWRRTRQ